MAGERILINHKEIESIKCYHFIKRIFDILLSTIGLIVLSPLMFIIAYKVKKEDGGPVIYKQVRVGKNGHHFEMYKFRSMVTNADQLLENLKGQNEVDGAIFKMKHDPRVTKIRNLGFITYTICFEVIILKVCLVGSSGGHLTHLYMLKPFWKNKDRFWVAFDKEDARSKLKN